MRVRIGWLAVVAVYVLLLLPMLVLPLGTRSHPKTYMLEFLYASPQRLLLDALRNMAAFVPLGWLLTSAIRPLGPITMRLLIVSAACAAFSFSVETLQFFMASRYSSLFDVVANTVGALAGALAVPKRNVQRDEK